MKNLVTPRSAIILLGAIIAIATPTAQAKLTVGDPAPKLQPGKWVQGEPVKGFDSNHVYIVEFWATWCGPCRTSIPHLNELHEKFKDKGLVAIGQDAWEGNEDAVAPFIKKMGRQMTYRVALDRKGRDDKGVMAETWMTAAGQNGIPTAFVVNREGRIAWIGHPMALDEKTLEEILADKFDVAKFAVEFEQQQEMDKRREALYKKLGVAMREKDWDAAESAVGELEKTMPESMRFRYGITRLEILLGRKDYDAAYKLAEALSDGHKETDSFQNDIAWTMVTHEGLDNRGLVLAEKIAEQANIASQSKSSAVLDTLARVQFLLGKKEQAIATQKKALEAATSDGEKRYVRRVLESYQKGELPKAGE